jgi:hypothetical protein
VEESEKPKAEAAENPKVEEPEKPKVGESEKPKVAEADTAKVEESEKPKAAAAENPKAEESEKPKVVVSEKPEVEEPEESFVINLRQATGHPLAVFFQPAGRSAASAAAAAINNLHGGFVVGPDSLSDAGAANVLLALGGRAAVMNAAGLLMGQSSASELAAETRGYLIADSNFVGILHFAAGQGWEALLSLAGYPGCQDDTIGVGAFLRVRRPPERVPWSTVTHIAAKGFGDSRAGAEHTAIFVFRTSQARELYDAAASRLEANHALTAEIGPVHPSPHQSDGYNCGVHSCACMYFLGFGMPYPPDLNADRFREFIAYSILYYGSQSGGVPGNWDASTSGGSSSSDCSSEDDAPEVMTSVDSRLSYDKTLAEAAYCPNNGEVADLFRVETSVKQDLRYLFTKYVSRGKQFGISSAAGKYQTGDVLKRCFCAHPKERSLARDITARSMARLTTNPDMNRWLTDASMNYFVHLLNAKEKHHNKHRRTVKFIDSNSTGALLAFDPESDLGGKNRMRMYKTYIATSGSNTDPIGKIFMVVHEQTHFFVCLLTLVGRLYTIRTIDSFNRKRTATAAKLMAALNRVLRCQNNSAAPDPEAGDDDDDEDDDDVHDDDDEDDDGGEDGEDADDEDPGADEEGDFEESFDTGHDGDFHDDIDGAKDKTEVAEVVVSEKPKVVVSEKPKVVVSEKPKVVVSEKPKVAVSEKPKVVVSEKAEVLDSDKNTYDDSDKA